MHTPPISLVIGGAASGKSAFAEAMIARFDRAKVYIATAQAFDDEMTEKIAAHRQARAGQGWTTVEAPRDLAAAIGSADRDAALLLDCMTLWLTNTLLADADWRTEWPAIKAALAERTGPSVLVTNDVSGGVVPDNALARQFRTAQGGLNQVLAERADCVVLVTAGLPQVLKGSVPA